MDQKKMEKTSTFSENKTVNKNAINKEGSTMDAVRFVKALDNVKRINEEFNRTIDELCTNHESSRNSFVSNRDGILAENFSNATVQ